MAPPHNARRGLDGMIGKATAWLPPCAGLIGGCGIIVSAAAAHLGGTSLALTGGLFLLLHAAALLALAALAERTVLRRYTLAGFVLALGSVLFCGDLALAGLYGWHPFAPAAPVGGLLLIAGWLVVPAAALRDALNRPGGPR